MKTRTKNFLYISGLVIFVLLGLYLRVYHIEFGLPHSFHADEPEIAELAIKYTYELRDVIKNNNYYKLIPIYFVYGTFPAYLFTAAVMAFSKTSNLIGSAFSKEDIYIFMRSFNAVLSLGIILSGVLLHKRLFNNRKGLLAVVLLLALNWKLIVHAHYVNADSLLTLLLSFCFLLAYLYYNHELDDKHVVVLGLLYGIAVGTKITALISLPLFLYLFLIKKDYRGFFGFIFLVFIGFAITNPFSLILAKDFVFRIYMMKVKEAGIVFDSVDSNPFKYILSLGFLATPLVLLSSVYAISLAIKDSHKKFHLFLVGNILIYILFYSLNSRRVDRWLLPIVPLVLLYGGEGIALLLNKLHKTLAILAVVTIFGFYFYYPYLLTQQFGRDTPKSAAYLWARENLPPLSYKLVITEEGLDHFNKLPGALVKRYMVYETDQAQFEYPLDPENYAFVVLSSKPMRNFKKKEVTQKYKTYTEAWVNFENTVLDESRFKLIKGFTLPKPNLVELSDVYIYQKVN